MKSALKAVLFDFDGTILDTETTEFRHWQALYRRHTRELSLTEWQRGVGTWDVFDPWAGLPEAVQAQKEEVLAEMREALLHEIEQQGLREGIREVLEAVKGAGLRLGLATSSDRDWVTRWLEHYHLTHLFEATATRYDVASVKPSPDLYLLAAEQLGVSPQECLAVEDSLNGGKAAAAAGMRVVVIPNEVTSTQAFPSEWARLDEFSGGLESLLKAAGI